MLVRYPRAIKSGTKVDGLALNVDVAPTILDFAGVDVPRDMQGRSWKPLLTSRSPKWRSSALLEYFFEKPYPRVPGWQSVRTDGWKFIHYTDLQGMDELYDLTNDPYEMKNLISESSSQTKLQELQDELRRLLDETK
jgi:arylsulfatase A-like enzyme